MNNTENYTATACGMGISPTTNMVGEESIRQAVVRIHFLRRNIFDLYTQLAAIQEEVECGMLDVDTAKAKVNILRKEIIEKKKRLIQEVHVGKRGNTLSMGAYNTNKGLFIVRCTDGAHLSSATEGGLLDALMEHYGLSLDSPLVKDVWLRAIEKYTRKHPDKSKTIYNYKKDYNSFISTEFAQKDIRRITVEWLDDYLLSLVKENNLKVSALKNCKTLLNLIYEQAITDGFATKNIAKEIKTKSLTQYCDQSLAHRKSEDVLYNDDEIDTIESDMWQRINGRFTSFYSYAVLLHMELGCRPDELICLKWSDFDFRDNLVSIERQQVEDRLPKQSFRVVEYTKNEKGCSSGGRTVPLSTKAITVLRRLKVDKEAMGIKSDWLFTDKDGELLKKKGYFDFNTALHKKMGTTVSGSYAFRRGVSARMEAAGIEPSERAAILGHSVETNLKHYTFAKPKYLDRVRAALG